jgi:hypothetical protein
MLDGNMNVDQYAFDDDDNTELEAVNLQANQCEEALTEDAQKLSDEIYKELSDEYDYRTTDEAVKETLIENEYQFTLEGKID